MATLLLITLLLPLAGALLLGGDRASVRRWALAIALVVFGMAAVLVAEYPGGIGPFAATDLSWLDWTGSSVDIRFSVALDGLSLWLFALTALLMVVAVLVGWEAIDQQASLYYRLLLILETGMLGVFVARDIILFYVFFEFTLIPLFFLIGIWGGQQRRYAAMKFFLFTLAGSVLTFLGLLAIVLWDYYHPVGDPAAWKMTFSIPELTQSLRDRPMDPAVQIGIFLALFAGFAIKVPLFPLHTWLPLAHVEAPTAGSVILAGVLLKVGVYGFARFNLPMLPAATAMLMPWLLWISLAGIIYGALVALAQRDIKRLIAYSSVSHLGFCMLGLFALNRLSVQGGVLQMINHGLSTGGLFAVVGMLYERYHTRQIADLGGLARRLPVLSFFTLVLTLSSIATPGLNGFVGEFLVLLGTFQRGWAEAPAAHWLQFRVIGVLGVAGVILGAWYMLWMYQRVFFGPLREPSPLLPGEGQPESSPLPPGEGRGEGRVRDLSPREIFCLAPLLVFIVWIGLQPRFFLDRMAPTLDELTAPAMQAVDGENGKLSTNHYPLSTTP
jgi:NADH-quinone oxidoreductase subunit M